MAKMRNAGLNRSYNTSQFGGEEGLGAKQRSQKHGSRSKGRNVMQSQNLSQNMGGIIGQRSNQNDNSMDRGLNNP